MGATRPWAASGSTARAQSTARRSRRRLCTKAHRWEGASASGRAPPPAPVAGHDGTTTVSTRRGGNLRGGVDPLLVETGKHLRGHPRRLPVGRRPSILCSWVETWGTSPGARLRDHFFSMLLQSFARLLRRCITMVVYGKHFHVGVTEPRNDFSPEYAFSCSLFLWRAPPWSSVGLGLGALFSRPQARSIEASLSLARILSMASSSCDTVATAIFKGISALGGQGKTEEVSRPAWFIVRVAKNTTQICVANGSPRFIF